MNEVERWRKTADGSVRDPIERPIPKVSKCRVGTTALPLPEWRTETLAPWLVVEQLLAMDELPPPDVKTPSDTPLDAGAADSAAMPVMGESPNSPRRSFKRRHWGKLTLLTLVAVPVLAFAIWTASTLNWSYSAGLRAGYLQKISRKGWVCKTWEGTLYTDIAKGFRSDSFSFSVRNDSLARVIETLSGKKIEIQYEQHMGVPTTCFGDTEYFVSGVRVLDQ